MTKPKTSYTLWLRASSTGNIWICWLTTIYCCSVRGKRGLWKREWCWARAGVRISRGLEAFVATFGICWVAGSRPRKEFGGRRFLLRGCKQFRTARESCKVEGKGHIGCLFAFQDFLIYSFGGSRYATRAFATPIFVASATPIFVASATPYFRISATQTVATPKILI